MADTITRINEQNSKEIQKIAKREDRSFTYTTNAIIDKQLAEIRAELKAGKKLPKGKK